MQVKVFEACDMTSGLKKVKEALGPDALILSTRTVRRGKYGLMGKPLMEITAAVDNDWQEASPKKRRTRNIKQPQRKVGKQEDLTYDNLWKSNEQSNPVAGNDPPAAGYEQSPALSAQAERSLQEEITELRSIVHNFSKRIPHNPNQALHSPYIEPEFSHPGRKAESDPVVRFLNSRGINLQTAKLVSRFTMDTIAGAGALDTADLASILATSIAKLFKTEHVLCKKLERQKRISLVGPTGVGKTTTIAKLAANYLNHFGGRIALITIDTYRIAAVEQLKVYGEIMKLPVEVVIKPKELERAFDKYQEYDLVLIDTAGRSPRNEMDLYEMASFLRPELGIDNHLLLSATTREQELEEIINRFTVLPISNYIFSKIDECGQLGVLLNLHYKNDTPISFLTNGQRVPEDIISPTPTTIADLIMHDQGM